MQLAHYHLYIPYQIDKDDESMYHFSSQAFIKLFGFESYLEVSTNKGRIDLVVLTKNYIYVFELKVNASALAALKQIEKRMYYERYLHDKAKRTIVLVGLAFNKRDNEPTVTCSCKTLTFPAYAVLSKEEKLNRYLRTFGMAITKWPYAACEATEFQAHGDGKYILIVTFPQVI